jgi:hypothetical protein
MGAMLHALGGAIPGCLISTRSLSSSEPSSEPRRAARRSTGSSDPSRDDGPSRTESDSPRTSRSSGSEGDGSDPEPKRPAGGRRSDRDEEEARLRSRVRLIATSVILVALAAYIAVDLFGRLFRDSSFRTADPTIFGILVSAILALAGVAGLDWLAGRIKSGDDK